MKYKWVPGKDAPESTKFMGVVRFRKKGPFVDVTDPDVLKKLENHQEFLSEEKAKKKAAKKKAKKVGNKG